MDTKKKIIIDRNPILNENFINYVLLNFKGNDYAMHIADRTFWSKLNKIHIIEEDLNKIKNELDLMLTNDQDFIKTIIDSNPDKYNKIYQRNIYEYEKEITNPLNIKDIIVKLYEKNRIDLCLLKQIADHMGIINYNEYFTDFTDVEYVINYDFKYIHFDELYYLEVFYLRRYIEIFKFIKNQIHIIENILNERYKRKMIIKK